MLPTMDHPLDGARLKIIRAQEHLESLKAEIGMYLHEQPHEVHSQPDMHVHRNEPAAALAAYYAQGSQQHVLPHIDPGVPPLRLSAIIGDVVTNSRAALDYTMCELAQRFFANPPVDITDFNDRRITAFPIDPRSKGQPLQSRLDALAKRGVPTAPIDEIKAVQPDSAGHESLGWLHELVNRDKHRMLLLTVGEFDDVKVTFRTPAIFTDDLTRDSATLSFPREYFATNQPPVQSNMQMKGQVAIYVTWQDLPVPREPVERTLEQIIETVAKVIARFDRFLT
jgi:hypothetical protein